LEGQVLERVSRGKAAIEVPQVSTTEPSACRHEYVRIYQRKLKGLERRLCVTRAYLPVGFKAGDFGHLGDGSYCFCSKCRARLYPKRTQAEKLAARQALARAAEIESEAAAAAELLQEGFQEEAAQESTQEGAIADIHVEELELESVDMQDIEAEGVKLSPDDTETCSLTDEDL
jgi:hypothetical protein